MRSHAETMGQAVYLRTDSPDFIEVIRPFRTLQDLVDICTQGQANMTLEKIQVFALKNGESCAVTLEFISATLGIRPAVPSRKKFEPEVTPAQR